jgi:hypothetical protein
MQDAAPPGARNRGPVAAMAYDVLALAIAAGVLFAGPVAWVYRRFRRKDPASLSQAWKIFATLALLIAVRFYFLNAP